MIDRLSKEERSWNMSRIKNKNTKPEIALRKALYKRGLRYRIHDRNLPGTPDIVFRNLRSVVFVNGCFWHRHEGCPNATVPTNRREFWLQKFNQTVTRDKRHCEDLVKQGWRVFTIWECEIKQDIESIADTLRDQLLGETP